MAQTRTSWAAQSLLRILHRLHFLVLKIHPHVAFYPIQLKLYCLKLLTPINYITIYILYNTRSVSDHAAKNNCNKQSTTDNYNEVHQYSATCKAKSSTIFRWSTTITHAGFLLIVTSIIASKRLFAVFSGNVILYVVSIIL